MQDETKMDFKAMTQSITSTDVQIKTSIIVVNAFITLDLFQPFQIKMKSWAQNETLSKWANLYRLYNQYKFTQLSFTVRSKYYVMKSFSYIDIKHSDVIWTSDLVGGHDIQTSSSSFRLDVWGNICLPLYLLLMLPRQSTLHFWTNIAVIYNNNNKHILCLLYPDNLGKFVQYWSNF